MYLFNHSSTDLVGPFELEFASCCSISPYVDVLPALWWVVAMHIYWLLELFMRRIAFNTFLQCLLCYVHTSWTDMSRRIGSKAHVGRQYGSASELHVHECIVHLHSSMYATMYIHNNCYVLVIIGIFDNVLTRSFH